MQCKKTSALRYGHDRLDLIADPRALIRFRRFRSSSLALASLERACRDHCPDVSATLTTMAFGRSSLRWLGINDLIAEPEGPSFISSTVAHRRVDRRCS